MKPSPIRAELLERVASAAAEAVFSYREDGPTDADTVEAVAALEDAIERLNETPMAGAPRAPDAHLEAEYEDRTDLGDA